MRIPLTPEAFARAVSRPHYAVTARTVRRWLAAWCAAGVAGITRVPSRGRYGVRYTIAPSVLRRYLRGELPSPHDVGAADEREAA
jgi:hypothetical protein